MTRRKNLTDLLTGQTITKVTIGLERSISLFGTDGQMLMRIMPEYAFDSSGKLFDYPENYGETELNIQ